MALGFAGGREASGVALTGVRVGFGWVVAVALQSLTEPMLKTAAREIPKVWPFFAGFAIIGAAVTKVSLGLTEEQKKASKFLNPGH